MASAASRLKVAACQILVGPDKTANLITALAALKSAAKTGAQLLVLPECFNSPYDTASFPKYAEAVPTCAADINKESMPSSAMLSAAARELGVFVVGGSIPERDGDYIFNTSLVFGPDGDLLVKHRKVHLFDIDVPGRITFRESDTLSPGGALTMFDGPSGVRIGLGICYDIRFPDYAAALRRLGAAVLIYPGAFNMTTGPAHWELLQRARAVDNQLFVITASPARNPDSSYVRLAAAEPHRLPHLPPPAAPTQQAWGHSSIVSPWGEVLATTEHGPAIVSAELDLSVVESTRASIPVSCQRRPEVYAQAEMST